MSAYLLMVLKFYLITGELLMLRSLRRQRLMQIVPKFASLPGALCVVMFCVATWPVAFMRRW